MSFPNAVAQKVAATQVFNKKTTEIRITVKEAEKREKENGKGSPAP